MAAKVLLIDDTNEYGIGLNAIRQRVDDLIDISSLDGHFDDATLIAGYQCLIKDDKVYRFVKVYYDLDSANKDRIFIAKLETNTSDIIDPPID